MSDLIKREDAIKVVESYTLGQTPIVEKLKDIPSAEPTIEIDAHQLAKLLREGWTIHSEPKQGEWIPCSERLPEKEEVVLVCYKTTDTVHLCKYIGNGEVGEGLNDWWSYVDDCCAWNNVVLAWMPLPEPWKGADDD